MYRMWSVDAVQIPCVADPVLWYLPNTRIPAIQGGGQADPPLCEMHKASSAQEKHLD